MAVKQQPSLPSFAQTFNVGGGPGSNSTLPPIHPISSSTSSKKRGRPEGADGPTDDSGRSSPLVKDELEEQEVDMLEPSPPPDTKRRRMFDQSAIAQGQRRGSIASSAPSNARRTAGPPSHTLPPPPGSFAHRRSASKKKPADILISPRESTSANGGRRDPFAPVIQSAPPIPTQNRMMSMMAIPRVPQITGERESYHGGPHLQHHPYQASPVRAGFRQPTRVPPTPTRFTVHAGSGAAHLPPPPQGGVAGIRSPPHASVPISSLRVPPTPSFGTHHPSSSSAEEKAAFLAPFETFYTALSDSRQLKSWLSEQLSKSQALLQGQEKALEDIVERKFGDMRQEISGLRRRVDDLERELSSRRRDEREGYEDSRPQEMYSFPHPPRRGSPSPYGPRRSRSNSPAPYETRRLSLSAARLEGPGPSTRAGHSGDEPA